MSKVLDYYIRPLTQEDEPFLWQMLYEAAHVAEEGESTVEAVVNHPLIAKYVKDWGRANDMGFAAIACNSSQPIGAAWLRLFTGDDKGFGWVNDTIPELAIALLPEYTNQGIGTQLLDRLLSAAKASYRSVSLSVRSSNLALSLYERSGFKVIEGNETINRTGGTSLIMQIDFD
ncbi:GNAT family N-acetyltransferase [Tychonema sp. LEGE 07199]|uniref:GNAT family N-acetyltransferase n=1 Tax=unclassified Tychonema TaxID=2642144 RepID=UPI0018801F89|nr:MULTISPECIES: GNAT family N-acetyltransferase [unclassified Tychonema]MBE9121394.1 GNAT family N-acetyltransferase [Tychonema sp. LEGE 07199]MBE9132552.1 GNAT family N-acetyltransferase [Tychonema sp. LEGE 07196]